MKFSDIKPGMVITREIYRLIINSSGRSRKNWVQETLSKAEENGATFDELLDLAGWLLSIVELPFFFIGKPIPSLELLRQVRTSGPPPPPNPYHTIG